MLYTGQSDCIKSIVGSRQGALQTIENSTKSTFFNEANNSARKLFIKDKENGPLKYDK